MSVLDWTFISRPGAACYAAIVLSMTVLSYQPLLAKEATNADKHLIDITTESCLSTHVSTAEMLDCYTHAEKAWDDELNSIYKSLQSHLKPAGQQVLKQAQLTWIAQRDKEFELINALHAQLDGTIWLPIMASKRAEVIRERALMLQSYLALLQENKS